METTFKLFSYYNKMASLKELENISKKRIICIDEPEELEEHPLTPEQHLKLLDSGKSGMKLPDLDFVLGDQNKHEEEPDYEFNILRRENDNEERKETFEAEPENEKEYSELYSKIDRAYTRLKQIVKRIFATIMSLKDVDLNKMINDVMDIIEGFSKGGDVRDIIRKEHIKSIGLFFILFSVIVISLNLIYSPSLF